MTSNEFCDTLYLSKIGLRTLGVSPGVSDFKVTNFV